MGIFNLQMQGALRFMRKPYYPVLHLPYLGKFQLSKAGANRERWKYLKRLRKARLVGLDDTELKKEFRYWWILYRKICVYERDKAYEYKRIIRKIFTFRRNGYKEVRSRLKLVNWHYTTKLSRIELVNLKKRYGYEG